MKLIYSRRLIIGLLLLLSSALSSPASMDRSGRVQVEPIHPVQVIVFYFMGRMYYFYVPVYHAPVSTLNLR